MRKIQAETFCFFALAVFLYIVAIMDYRNADLYHSGSFWVIPLIGAVACSLVSYRRIRRETAKNPRHQNMNQPRFAKLQAPLPVRDGNGNTCFDNPPAETAFSSRDAAVKHIERRMESSNWRGPGLP